jgi:hypothetical protein
MYIYYIRTAVKVNELKTVNEQRIISLHVQTQINNTAC